MRNHLSGSESHTDPEEIVKLRSDEHPVKLSTRFVVQKFIQNVNIASIHLEEVDKLRTRF